MGNRREEKMGNRREEREMHLQFKLLDSFRLQIGSTDFLIMMSLDRELRNPVVRGKLGGGKGKGKVCSPNFLSRGSQQIYQRQCPHFPTAYRFPEQKMADKRHVFCNGLHETIIERDGTVTNWWAIWATYLLCPRCGSGFSVQFWRLAELSLIPHASCAFSWRIKFCRLVACARTKC